LPADRSSICCLGIDPGIGRMGFGLVSQSGNTLTAFEYGCIETPPADLLPRRLLRLFSSLEEILDRVSPDFFAVERLYFGRNTTTAEAVWQARAVVLLLAAQRGLDVFQPKPAEVKMAVAGNGNATKGQVRRMVCEILRLSAPPTPDDVSDALAIAITGLAMRSVQSRLNLAGGPVPC
jgi:crossover junction endodeoxyribonuclease RuvC